MSLLSEVFDHIFVHGLSFHLLWNKIEHFMVQKWLWHSSRSSNVLKVAV